MNAGAVLLLVLGAVRLAAGVVLLEAWGWSLARWLFGDRIDSTQRAALGAVLATASIGMIGYAAWIAGLGLSFVVGAAVLLGLVGLANSVSSGRKPHATAETRQVVGWALLSAVVAAVEGIWLSDSADMFYHLAATRSLLVADRPLVTDLIVARPPSLGLDPTSGIWPTVLAVLARISGLDPVWLIRLLSPVLAALIAVGFLALVRRVVAPRGRTLAMVLMLVVAYQLDFRWAAYPNRIGLAFAAVALSAIVVFVEEGGAGGLAASALLAATVAAMHLGAFELYALIAGVFAVLGIVWPRAGAASAPQDGASGRTADVAAPGGVRARIAGVAAASLAAGGVIAATKLIPAMESIGFRVGNADRLVDVRSQIPLLRMGPLAAMLPGKWLVGGAFLLPAAVVIGAALVARRAPQAESGAAQATRGDPGADPATRMDQDAAPVAPGFSGAAALMAAAIALSMPLLTWNLVGVSFIARTLWYHVVRVGAIWPIFLGVPAGALYARLAETRSRSWWRQLAVAGLVAGLLVVGGRWGQMLSGPKTLFSIWHSRVYDLGWRWRWAYEPIRQELAQDPSPAVAAPLSLSYHVVGMLPARVIAVPSAHMPYFAERLQGAKRRHDVFTLFEPSTSKADSLKILSAYRARWVLAWIDRYGRIQPPGARRFMGWRDVMVPVYRARPLILFRVYAPPAPGA